MQPEIGLHEIDKVAKEKAQGSHGYAVLRWFYTVYKADVGGINSAYISSTRGSRGCPPGTLPCLQGIVCYTCRPQGYGNGGRKVGQSALYHRLGKGTGAGRYTKSGQTANSMARNLLGRYCQSSLSGPSSEGKPNFATKRAAHKYSIYLGDKLSRSKNAFSALGSKCAR